MRLNKWQKQAFLTCLMEEMPKPPSSEDLELEIQTKLNDLIPDDILNIIEKYPGLIEKKWHWLGPDTHVVLHTGVMDKKDLNTLLHPYKNTIAERLKTQTWLKGAVNSCRTDKDMLAMFPDFKHHIPTENEPTANLPAVSGVPEALAALGWKKKPN